MKETPIFLDACCIEDARDSQAKEIRAVIHEATQPFGGSFYLDTKAFPELQCPQTSAQARGGKAIVTYFDARIISFGFIRKSFASYMIDHFYVSAIHQRKGVGQAMLAELATFALEQTGDVDTDPICVEIWLDNKLSLSISFFEAMGFVKSGEQRRRLKKLPHLSEDERDASSVEICLLLLLKTPAEETE